MKLLSVSSQLSQPLKVSKLLTKPNYSRLYSILSNSQPDLKADHVVIGGGVVGLAVTNYLSQATSNTTTILLEKNGALGQETSSRNSEVIHGGFYYPNDSKKSKFCIEGKHLLYEFCNKYNVPYKKLGKWVVSQNTPSQLEYLNKLKLKGDELGIELEFVPTSKLDELEPNVNCTAALNSPSTGIIDSGEYINRLEYLINEREGAEITLNSEVIDIQRGNSNNTYLVQVKDPSNPESQYLIETSSIINCAGLYADKIANLILNNLLDEASRKKFNVPEFKYNYSKGQYFKYSNNQPLTQRLIYPVPDVNLTSLGIHLTLDLDGKVKFGPDLAIAESATDYSVNEKDLDKFYAATSLYMKNLDKTKFLPDYCGIRPKLVNLSGGYQDFVVRNETEIGLKNIINLVAIESPGLTSSLSIGKWVKDQLI